MKRKELEKIMDDDDIISDLEGDNIFMGLQVLSKYTNNLITHAEHDQIWSEGVEEVLEAGITSEDVKKLSGFNWMIDEDSFSHFA